MAFILPFNSFDVASSTDGGLQAPYYLMGCRLFERIVTLCLRYFVMEYFGDFQVEKMGSDRFYAAQLRRW